MPQRQLEHGLHRGEEGRVVGDELHEVVAPEPWGVVSLGIAVDQARIPRHRVEVLLEVLEERRDEQGAEQEPQDSGPEGGHARCVHPSWRKGFMAAAVCGSRGRPRRAPARRAAAPRSSAVSTSYQGRLHATLSPAGGQRPPGVLQRRGNAPAYAVEAARRKRLGAAIMTHPPSSAGASATSQRSPATRAQPSSDHVCGAVSGCRWRSSPPARRRREAGVHRAAHSLAEVLHPLGSDDQPFARWQYRARRRAGRPTEREDEPAWPPRRRCPRGRRSGARRTLPRRSPGEPGFGAIRTGSSCHDHEPARTVHCVTALASTIRSVARSPWRCSGRRC